MNDFSFLSLAIKSGACFQAPLLSSVDLYRERNRCAVVPPCSAARSRGSRFCAVVCVWSSSAGGSSSAEQRVAAPAESVSASVFLDNPVRRFSNFCHREAGMDRVRGSSPRIASPRALTATGS